MRTRILWLSVCAVEGGVAVRERLGHADVKLEVRQALRMTREVPGMASGNTHLSSLANRLSALVTQIRKRWLSLSYRRCF